MAQNRPDIPTRTRVIGRTISTVVSRAPWLWPVIRRPVQGFFDNLASGWDERTGGEEVDRLLPLASACEHVRPAPERVLDVGTGTGSGALFLAREFPQARVRGVDLSEGMIKAARAKVELDREARIAFKVADASKLPYPDAYFDLVAQVNMPPFFEEIARVLAPGGYVIVVASHGAATPFYTPEAVLRRGFSRHGIEAIEGGVTGRGTWFVGRSGSG